MNALVQLVWMWRVSCIHAVERYTFNLVKILVSRHLPPMGSFKIQAFFVLVSKVGPLDRRKVQLYFWKLHVPSPRPCLKCLNGLLPNRATEQRVASCWVEWGIKLHLFFSCLNSVVFSCPFRFLYTEWYSCLLQNNFAYRMLLMVFVPWSVKEYFLWSSIHKYIVFCI